MPNPTPNPKPDARVLLVRGAALLVYFGRVTLTLPLALTLVALTLALALALRTLTLTPTPTLTLTRYAEPGRYTRGWFAMANSAFAEAILTIAETRPHLLFKAGR